MTKVVHLQTHLPTSGNAAFRLHESMSNKGIDSYMLSLSSAKAIGKKNASLGTKASLKALINSKFHNKQTKNIERKFGLFSNPIVGNDISQHPFVSNAQIIYIHWAIGGFLSLKNIKQITKLGKPIIIFMHDMWHITGGCHHSFSCTNYKNGCKTCQMFPNGSSLPAKGYRKKASLYQNFDNLYFVSPSSWLANLAQKSGLTKNKPVFKIPNVINRKLFKPFSKKEARNILNLNQEDTIIAFGAISPTSPYKGWEYLKKSLELLAKNAKHKNIEVLVFGSDYNSEIANAISFRTRFLGRFYDDYSTALIYNAANVFMAPSIADNLPTTIMESLCCGTPVVGFNIGGIPELISHKQNGYLAAYKNAEDLTKGIHYCLDNTLNVTLSDEFETNRIIERHLKLHKEITTVTL